MASVHRAYDTARGHVVALKRLELPSSFTSGSTSTSATHSVATLADLRTIARRRAQLVALFQHEYRTLAQLTHPRIVEVYDYGFFDDKPYYTMELLQGRDLGNSGRLSWREVSSILCDVASALTLLHAQRLLHRDVAPRNVHCSSQGRAKLLDFGAMSAMGKAELLVGTPAFVAPEAVQRKALDARSDLYSLGAVGYMLLTGAPPYRAQNFNELPEAQRNPPAAPSLLVQDVPPALDELIMQLIQLDRAARPGSAVEVVERLRALAGLEHDARLAVASAYLSGPTLVGRQTQLRAVRRRVLRSQRRHGASLQVAGPPGSGRSRFLDACALEGKLAGALVLRSDPTAAGGCEFGAVRSLLLQLHASLSESERLARRPPQLTCDQLLPGLRWQHSAAEQASVPPPRLDRSGSAELARATHDYLVQFATERPLMIVVDDFEGIDTQSAALFANLSQAALSCKLVLVTACKLETTSSAEPAQLVLREHSRPLRLAPLTASETHALLRAICGDVPNLQLLTDRLHALSAGSPSLCIELTRHLIERQVIRYEAGGFMLPDTLTADDFPKSLEQVLRARFARLSVEARELGSTIALAAAPLRIEQCLRIVDAGDRQKAQRVFGELLEAEVLLKRGECVTLRQSAFGAAFLGGVAAEQKRQLHARAAELLREDPSLRVAAAEHYLLADQPGDALDLLVPAAENDSLFQEWFGRFDALIATALRACEQLDRPAHHAFMLRRARVRYRLHFVESGDRALLLEYARELEPQTGLAHYRELDPTLAPQERMMQALKFALAQYEATPERERLYAPLEALTELATYTAALAGYAVATFDVELNSELTSLEPFTPLSPAISWTHKLCMAVRDLREGRHEAYYSALDELLESLERPDHAGLPERAYGRARLGLVYLIGMGGAALGRSSAFAHANELDATPQTRGLAWQVRYLTHLYRGDPHSASECRRELEWLSLQEDFRNRYQGSATETESMYYARADDVLGLRRVLPGLERMAERFSGWQLPLWLARGELERLRGRFEQALTWSERMLSATQPGKHDMWGHASALHVRGLFGLGRLEEARAFGIAALAQMHEHQIVMLCAPLRSAVAQVYSALGDYTSAIEEVDGTLSGLNEQRVSGLYGGLWNEQRARLALHVDDTAGFWLAYQRCSDHYGNALDSPFAQRIARLSAEEREHRMDRSEERARKLAEAEQVVVSTQRELATCVSAEARALRGLSRLLELTSTDTGYLFGVRSNRLVLLAALGYAGASDGLVSRLEHHLQSGELGAADATAFIDERNGSYLPHVFEIADDRGQPCRALAITNAGGATVAIAAVCTERDLSSTAVFDLLGALGQVMFAHADVDTFDPTQPA